VELDGPRHRTARGEDHDRVRDASLRKRGYVVIRIHALRARSFSAAIRRAFVLDALLPRRR
jgi:very-short-patch-repair endonuclease